MSAKNQSDLSAIGADVALLKRDISRLTDHVKNGTFDLAKG
jgi:ribosomal protein S15P/S13E